MKNYRHEGIPEGAGEAWYSMRDFSLFFNDTNFKQLDEFALLVCQDYNLGKKDDWFGAFRESLYGFYARLYGITVHYEIVHAWLPTPRSPTETEYHLSSILFNMDSAIECLTFTLNALGYAAASDSFRDISDTRDLKKVSPKDILGDPSRRPLKGYDIIFPKVVALWQRKRDLLNRIIELHDVSKHRQTIYVGGMMRSDPPKGFYESIGIPDVPEYRSRFWPMAEIILQEDPKTPRIEKIPQPAEGRVLLETLALEFVDFIQDTGDTAFNEAKANIVIPEQSFKRQLS